MGDSIYSNREKYVHMTGAGAAITRSGHARLIRVVVNDPAAQTLTIYDNNAASGSVVAVIDCANAGTFEYGIPLSTGLTASLSGTADITVVYE